MPGQSKKQKDALKIIKLAIKWRLRPLNSFKGWKALQTAASYFYSNYYHPDKIKLNNLNLSKEQKKIIRVSFDWAQRCWGDYEEKLFKAIDDYINEKLK